MLTNFWLTLSCGAKLTSFWLTFQGYRTLVKIFSGQHHLIEYIYIITPEVMLTDIRSAWIMLYAIDTRYTYINLNA